MVEALVESDEALAWLEGRGLTHETIWDAQLGYVPRGTRSPYWHAIAIPYRNARGEVQRVRYRHLRPDPPSKYVSPKGFGTHLYNVAATNEPTVAICEGEFDALVMNQIGVPAVAIPGATTWQREWRWLFRNADLVYVITDADEEGMKARAKIAAQIGQVTTAEVVELPEGKDVTDVFLDDPDLLKGLLL